MLLAFTGILIYSSPGLSDTEHREPVLGFPGSSADSELENEERFARSLHADNLRESLRRLSGKPHNTGTPGSLEVAQFVAEKFRAWGFDTEIETFYALMSTPRETVVEMTSPREFRAALAEPLIPGRTPEDTDGLLPPYNVFSRDGDVTANAVYVNYGLPEDYEVLRVHGIDVTGKIVVARYGAAFRGIKPRLAAENGALGAVLFSDPADVGSALGATYPDGPFLPDDGYQRGSVMDVPRIAGDPLTPGKGSTRRADSFSLEDAARSISPIPVLPLSANDIRPILEAMEGAAAPAAWQGALPLVYRFGGNVELHLRVVQNWDIVPLHDVVARIEGSEWPDQWVLRGNNHDAWNYGAMVALSGLVALMEEARGIGELARSGWRPRRTLVYLAWDGEEQGLMGSTEWAETHAAELRDKAVAYVNSGVTTRGEFVAGGSHVLEALVSDVASAVATHGNGARADGRAGDVGGLRLAPLGLGSDFTPFLHHLGIASLDIAIEGGAPSGVYHSIYDNFDFYDRFGDPGYVYGVRLAEAGGRIMLRLADADILPFDFTRAARAIAEYAAEIHEELARLEPPEADDVSLAALESTIGAFAASAERFATARRRAEARSTALPAHDLARLNAVLASAEAEFAPEHGLPGRPWYRHHIYAPGYDSGYTAETLPGVREAIARGQWQEARRQVLILTGLIRAYVARLDVATAMLDPGNPEASRGDHGQ